MKKILTILLVIVAINTFAQNTKKCLTPVSNYTFQQLFTLLNSKQDEGQKLTFAKKMAGENCLSTDQVRQIAETFGNDFNKLAFVQEAYDNITDKDNFYEVYNTFSYFSTVFRLHDFVAERKGGIKADIEIPQNKVMTFPQYDYPDYRKYFGKIGCTSLVSDPDFLSLAEKVFKETTEDKKLAMANNIGFNYCLQTAQAMKIASLMQNEQSRLDFLKKAFAKVFDPDNYKFAIQVFGTENVKKEFNNFLGGGIGTVTNPPCEVNPQDFASVKSQISKQSFVNTKITLAKQLLKTKKCFKTTQIIEILALFTYSDSKMDMAKYAYDYTTDKENYVKVAESFSFSKDKDDFLAWLKTK